MVAAEIEIRIHTHAESIVTAVVASRRCIDRFVETGGAHCAASAGHLLRCDKGSIVSIEGKNIPRRAGGEGNHGAVLQQDRTN